MIKRVLFNNGSASDVLYYDAIKKLEISDDQLMSFPMPLIGEILLWYCGLSEVGLFSELRSGRLTI